MEVMCLCGNKVNLPKNDFFKVIHYGRKIGCKSCLGNLYLFLNGTISIKCSNNSQWDELMRMIDEKVKDGYFKINILDKSGRSMISFNKNLPICYISIYGTLSRLEPGNKVGLLISFSNFKSFYDKQEKEVSI